MLSGLGRKKAQYLVLASLVAVGCTTVDEPQISGYRPPDGSSTSTGPGLDGAIMQETPPSVSSARQGQIQIPGAAAIPELDGGNDQVDPRGASIRPTRVAFDNAPLPTFINAVFAETLKFSIRMDPAVASRTEKISLRTGDPVSGQNLFDIASSALSDYGIEIIVESPKTLRFTTIDRQRGGAPQVFRGGSINRNAATGDSPVYYLYTIRATSLNSLVTVLSATFGAKLQVTGSPSDNALLFTGSPATISSALELLQSFDQPRLAGKPAVTISPVYFTPTKMADALAKVLRTSGYAVSTAPDASAINILPLDEVGSIVIFAADDSVRQFVVDLAEQMDEPRQMAGTGQAFIYFVKNTDVDSVADVISAVLGNPTSPRNSTSRSGSSSGSLAGNAQAPAQQPQQQQQTGSVQAGATTVQAGDMKIAVDPARNALIIMGSAEQYGSILPLLRQIDKSAGEVLIEVVLAEVTITDKTSLGVEFDFGDQLRGGNVTGGNNGLGLGSSGFSLSILDRASNAQIMINTLAKKDRVNILSNPRVVSKSGSEAHIQVGTQVPVLRQQSTNPGQGQTGVTNSVDYIDTGVVLNVRPIIRADNRVDIDISQEVSEAQTNNTSDISSPLIFTRSLATSLSLQDGQTVLLGGLKSQNRSNTRTGIPLLQDIPGVGGLFRSESAGVTDTELLVFITPYLVSNPAASDAVVQRYRESMREWPKVSGTLQW